MPSSGVASVADFLSRFLVNCLLAERETGLGQLASSTLHCQQTYKQLTNTEYCIHSTLNIGLYITRFETKAKIQDLFGNSSEPSALKFKLHATSVRSGFQLFAADYKVNRIVHYLLTLQTGNNWHILELNGFNT